MKKIFLAILLLGGSVLATKYAGEFTDLGVSVRAAGMGGVFNSFDGDPQLLWWNPAGLTGTPEKPQFYFMHAAMFDNLYQLDAGAAAKRLGDSFWGIGFFRNATDNIAFTNDDGYFDYGADGVPGTGDAGEGNGQWDPGERIAADAVHYRSEGDYLFTIAAGKNFGDKLNLGLSLKHLQSYIGEYSAFGFGADIGAQYRIDEKAVLAATLRDALGTHIRWSTGLWEQKLPSLWWGGKYDIAMPSIRGGLSLAGEFETRFENYDGIVDLGPISIDPHIGAELNLLKHIYLRAGIERNSLAAGVGLGISFFRVDYAFVNNPDLDVTHRIGIDFEIPEIKFPKKKKPEIGVLKPTVKKVEPSILDEEQPIPAPIGERIAVIQFPFGSADIDDEAKIALDSVCAIWNEHRTNRIYIEGHTDNIRIDTPEFADNYALSEARAKAVAGFLRDVCGVPANRIETDWFGPDRPKSDNSTEEGRNLNRRVEIFLWEP
ncbi:OmpA family protein [bacterium]|nr:OmpA family protein [bacterium]